MQATSLAGVTSPPSMSSTLGSNHAILPVVSFFVLDLDVEVVGCFFDSCGISEEEESSTEEEYPRRPRRRGKTNIDSSSTSLAFDEVVTPPTPIPPLSGMTRPRPIRKRINFKVTIDALNDGRIYQL